MSSEAAGAPVCRRHPTRETRVSCVQCGAPICPDCMVEAPVGFKCPDCARQSRRARGMGKPRQYTRAIAFGVGASAAAAFVLHLVFRQGFLSWIASGVAGYLVAEAVRRGAQGNRADPFRYLGLGLAIAAVVGGWLLVVGGSPILAWSVVTGYPLHLVTFLAAAYGAYRSTG